LTITDVNWRHTYVAPIFTGTRLSDITVFEYRLRIPSASPQLPYINIGWDDNVTDVNIGFRGRLVYSPPSSGIRCVAHRGCAQRPDAALVHYSDRCDTMH
jgi:hypothetical protein